MPSCRRWLLLLTGSLLLSGCGSIRYDLPGHSHQTLNTPVTLAVGEHRLALELPRRIPAPGGFELALVSEDASIVTVEYQPGPGGSGTYALVARATGTVTLHYSNRFSATTKPEELAQLRKASLGAFTVTVTAPR